MRLFLAVDLPDEIKNYLSSFKDRFSDMKKGCSWVRRDNLHITLKFLGDVKEEELEGIKDRLATIQVNNFYLTLNQLGFFPNENNMKVFWVNFIDGKPLKLLSDQINKELPDFKEDHVFKDHVTLARIKFLTSPEKDHFIKKIKETTVENKKFLVEEFVLYQSHLSPQGSKYEILKHFKLT